MKNLDRNQFVNTHQPCPCGKHKGCYSERTDGSGYCFSCGKNLFGKHSIPRQSYEKKRSSFTRIIKRVSDESYIRTTMIENNIDESPFFQTFRRVTNRKPIGSVGAIKNNVFFWYKDYAGIVRNCKEIYYQPNGFNRDKGIEPQMKYLSRDGYITPFWGEQFLQYVPQADLIIVESEKSALYGEVVLKKYLWLACGGSNGCTRDKIERAHGHLEGRRIFICFDQDSAGEEGAKNAVKNFRECGITAFTIQVTDFFPDVPKGCDIADAILLASGVTL